MKLSIEVRGENSEKQLIHLKKYLEKSRLDELKSVKVNKSKAKKGEMGAGAISSLTAVLLGIAGPFSRIADSFTRYATSFRTELILKNEHGDELVLNTKKLDKEGINYLVEQFLQKQSSKSSRRTGTRTRKS